MATAIKPYTEWHHIHAIISVARAQLRLQFTLRCFQCKTFATQLISVVARATPNTKKEFYYISDWYVDLLDLGINNVQEWTAGALDDVIWR